MLNGRARDSLANAPLSQSNANSKGRGVVVCDKKKGMGGRSPVSGKSINQPGS